MYLWQIRTTILACAALAALTAAPLLANHAVARPWIDMGYKDDLALFQPLVKFELFEQLPGGQKGQSLGPTGDGFIFFTSEFILDTGATSIIAMNDAASELTANGYQTIGQVEEQGISGTEFLDVSDDYYLEITDSVGGTNALPTTRIMSGQFPDLPVNGIVGMPGMAGKVVTLDTSHWTMLDEVDPNDPFAILELLTVNTRITNTLPASGGHRYSVPIRAQAFPLEGDVLPAASPIPFLEMSVGNNGASASGSFILDTGAQMSFVSSEVAKAIGLDSNGDGELDEDDAQFFDYLPVGGIGGTIAAPQFYIDSFTVPTEQGVDLVWSLDDSLSVLIVDIHPDIDGVLGSDLLTSGWLQFSFEELETEGADGPILQSHFDFRQFFEDGDVGKIYFDLTPSFDVLQGGGMPGDYNQDGVVDAADYSVWRNAFGGVYNPAADGNNDEVVDLEDYSIWKQNYGAGGVPASGIGGLAGVPEPSSRLLLLVSAVGLFWATRNCLRRSTMRRPATI